MRLLIVIITSSLVLLGCSTPGSAVVTPNTQGAQTVGGSQGQATAAETGSASGRITPLVVNALAARLVRITVNDGNPTVEVEANPDAEVHIAGGSWGYQTLNETNQDSGVSSGGPGAGGTGGVERTGSGGQITGTGGN